MLGNDVKGLLLMTHGYGARRVGKKNGFFLGASVEGAETLRREAEWADVKHNASLPSEPGSK